MPTYAYACTECDHRFEVVQSFDDDTLTVCPECEGRLRKVFNAVGIVFKGGGFYRTDSRSGSSRDGGSAPSEKPGGSTSGSAETAGSGSTKTSSGTARPASGGSAGGSASTASSPGTAPSTTSS